MKEQLIKTIISHLHKELSQLLVAANNAHLAAIDDQSIAETQYDTLAIEAGYLAEGQSRRVEEIKQAIIEFKNLPERINNSLQEKCIINLGSLVQVSNERSKRHLYFIAPAAAGFRCELNEANITVITPQSPLGNALMNLEEGDEFNVIVNAQATTQEVISIK